ncbi:hypothetical protein I551_4809 [Mycobacterium ulcerans str. Harvey]|uniref:Uncharacterized protein n=1 Tax=Mycobacterium ulcerans str. Harvey TaxID=1299332 RepID=A0ABP3ABH9_MYCUL|nr:hypothetical protein I551_4809 [Mycobacterium ulcerans str. Harvey]
MFLEAVFRPSARAEMTDVAVADSNASMITLLTADWAVSCNIVTLYSLR